MGGEESVCSGKGELQQERNKVFDSGALGSLGACGKGQECSLLGTGCGAGSKEGRSLSAVPPSLTALWHRGQGTSHLHPPRVPE